MTLRPHKHPLRNESFTHMALLAHRFDIYTAVFCVNFLSEIGQQFNKDEAPPVDGVYQRHLEAILQRLLDG